MSDSFATPWTVVHQAPLSMEFPREECWSGLPFPSPGDLPRPGTEPSSPALAGGFFTTESQGKPSKLFHYVKQIIGLRFYSFLGNTEVICQVVW